MAFWNQEGQMKVLVALEDANSAKTTVQSVTKYFPADKAELRLLHVVNSLEFATSTPVLSSYTSAVEVEQKEGQAVVAAHVERLRGEGYRVDSEVLGGETAETILSAAERWKAEVIVVGSRGGGQMRQFLLGSVAYAVVRRAGCTVLVLREGGV
jgi:nucleotide-binding universal stress UspA family protein